MSESAVDRVLLCLEEANTDEDVDAVVVVDKVVAVDVDRTACKRAFECRTFLADRRVLDNLLSTERCCRPRADYFDSQPEIEPYMRNMVTGWMQEVLEEQHCEEDVFPLSVNYLDRVLSHVTVRKTQLQLVAAVCMFIASKFKDTVAVGAERLVMYTDYSITLDQLMEWELLVLEVLRWDLSAVTAHDYVEQLLCRLPVDAEHTTSVKRHTQTFITMCTADVAFASCLPSKMAAACISSAANGLLGHVWCQKVNLLQKLQQLTSIDAGSIRSCQDQVEQLLNNNVRDSTSGLPAADVMLTPPSTPTSKPPCYPAHPATPTDVRDIRVCH